MRKLAAQLDASLNASKGAVFPRNTAPFFPESLRRFYGDPESQTGVIQFGFNLAGKGGISLGLSNLQRFPIKVCCRW